MGPSLRSPAGGAVISSSSKMEPPLLPALSAAQRAKDEEHLRLLAIFHYVVAGIGALFASIPLIHVAMGLLLFVVPAFAANGRNNFPPQLFGLIFVAMGCLAVALGWTAAVCTFISGRYLAKRRKRMFSFVMAAIMCMFMPFGTVLGIFTIIVLNRESVQRLYISEQN
jgi:hypothetical protein